MSSPSLASLGKVLVAGVLLTATTNVEACLFPCFWGWGGGYYAPPPMYAAPMYGGPAYAPSPCGPGGCGAYYGPQACCAPCGTNCGCGPGGCASGACGANYSSDMTPQPDKRPTPRTYTEPGTSGSPSSTSGMDDDFEPSTREPAQHGADGPETNLDPFKPPTGAGTGAGTGSGASDAPPPVEATPIGDVIAPMEMGLRVKPVRQRTIARAQYRAPRVARFDVQPEPGRFSIAESRLVTR